MTKLWQDLVAVHDTSSGFGHLNHNHPGLPYYADRALLLPVDLAVVMHDGENVEQHLKYLSGVGIGPKRVLYVGAANLFDGLDADPAAMEAVEARLRKGGRLQFFSTSVRSEAFVAQHGLQLSRIHSAPRVIADRMNDKVELRRIAHDCGLSHAVLPHAASRDPAAVMAAVKGFLAKPASEAEFVVVKRTNLAGGDGFMRLTRDLSESEVEERMRDYLRAQSWNELTVSVYSQMRRHAGAPVTLDRAEVRDIGRGDIADGVEKMLGIIEDLFANAPEADTVVIARDNISGGASLRLRRGTAMSAEIKRYLLDHCRNEILVEAGFDHVAFSTQIVVSDGPMPFRFLGPTMQIVDANGRHMGNILVRFYDESLAAKGMSEMDKQVMESFSFDLAKYAHTDVERYHGTIGFDFMKRKSDGRIFLLECNARQTAATYPLAVSAQLEGRLREPLNTPKREKINWGIVMHNAVPTSALSWGAVEQKLGGLLFNGVYGALPFNVRLMQFPEPHIGIVAVGKTLDKALAIMRLARIKLH